jgi:hypothetical protein
LVDQRVDSESLGEAAQLADRGGALVQVHEMRLDATFGEEAQGGTGVGALPEAEDLDFHR